MDEGPFLISVAQAARLLGCSKGGVERLIAQEVLPFFRFGPGGDRRLPVWAIEGYVRTGQPQTLEIAIPAWARH